MQLSFAEKEAIRKAIIKFKRSEINDD